ncbi:MAG: hypothetical protein PHS14_19580 [Elusimicrobia bacterium]|nr:hypothetical protein [Elusimicrobiota bacterium]
MAGTGSARGGLGWVILVIALAVPGVLFYNWWSHLKTDRERTVAAKARGRVPEGGVFQSSPNAKLVNPMTPSVSTEAATSPVAASTGAAHAAPAAAAAPAQEARAATLAAPAVAETAAGAVPPAGGAPATAFSSATATAPPLKRDPTLSPFDQVRIIEQEEARRKAAEDLENMKRAKQEGRRPKKIRAVDPATLVNLQGIVSNPESGFKAIVNDEVLGAGEFVGNTKIKIIKITDLGVTFEHQGKRFSKGVSRD